MKNKIKIIEERQYLLKQRLKLDREQRKINRKEHRLKDRCAHEFVFMWNSNGVHKVGDIYKCLCPVCGRFLDIVPNSDKLNLENSSFKKSNIINISSDRKNDEFNYYKFVEDEFLTNMDFYYDHNVSLIEKGETISDKLNNKGNTKYKIKRKEFDI